MIVMKFGGSSLADGNQVRKVASIVQGKHASHPLVVCSAHKGITNLLIAQAKLAAEGKADAEPIISRQREIMAELECPPDLLDPLFTNLQDLLRGISLVRELSPRVFDHVQSFGERMSVRTVAHAFNKVGIKAQAFDAWDLGFITDNRFGMARPLQGYQGRIKSAVTEAVAPDTVAVVTGFVGHTAQQAITTVGRNGSDFSAAVFAAALGAEECQIWTDTDGVMSSDPNLIEGARSIPSMSFAEAGELAWYGGRVLHPSTLIPAVEHNVPVRVLNTNRPEHPGTVITASGGEASGPVTSIAYKKGQSVVTISSPRMLGQPGFLAKVFEVFGRHGVDLDMISTSEISVSMTCEPGGNLAEAVKELENHGRVQTAESKALVCIVGRELKAQPGLAAKVFGALSANRVNVEMISHGANNINLSLVVDDAVVDQAVVSLHEALF